MQRPLLIGACPPKWLEKDFVERHSPLFPLPTGGAGHRLSILVGLNPIQYLKTFDRLNLLPDPKYSDRWSKTAATYAAVNLLRGGVLRDRYTVLLGRSVQAAFAAVLGVEVGSTPMHAWFKTRKDYVGENGRLAFVYHPSGRTREWSQDSTRAAARACLRAAIEGSALPPDVTYVERSMGENV